ncbi:hypothetical protein PRIC1_012753 [Phytophthora ramorum]
MAPSSCVVNWPEHLPADIVEGLCSFFTGFDAFNLSQSTSRWRNYLSDESFWKTCFRASKASDKELQSWKQRYIQSRSLLFTVQHQMPFAYLTCRNDKHPSAHFQITHMGGKSFSFDVWFSLLPAATDGPFGGILYGIQSSSRESGHGAFYHKHLVSVSSTGDLYCSLLADGSVVARDLKPSVWYHVALTYDHAAQSQEVFVNGVQVQSKSGTWQYLWHFMMYGQIGTGYSTADCPGWVGFHGVIDEFRVWGGVLSQDDVTLLASGGVVPGGKLQASLQHSKPGTKLRNVRVVKCTRPAEARRMQEIK